jgi:hypothetical protein
MTPQEPEYFLIPVARSDGRFAKVDADGYARHSAYKWFARKPKPNGKLYVVRQARIDGRYYRFAMHREVLSLPWKGKEFVDHINHDTFDNRKCNLRRASAQQNQMNKQISPKNKSGYKGVVKLGNMWGAYIKHNRKSMYLGRFSTPELAHAAYYAAAVKFFGEFACH